MTEPFILTPEWTERIERLCEKYELGGLGTVTQAAHGRNNLILMLNDLYVLRFDMLQERKESRFAAEKWAYDLLVDSGVPVPRVLAVDTSREIAPMDVLIMKRVPGEPLITLWPALEPDVREHLAGQIGAALARMHLMMTEAFGGKFGRLRKLNTRPLARWVDWTDQFYSSYRRCADERGTIPAPIMRTGSPTAKTLPGWSILNGARWAIRPAIFRLRNNGIKGTRGAVGFMPPMINIARWTPHTRSVVRSIRCCAISIRL
jgi:hypothetical protein